MFQIRVITVGGTIDKIYFDDLSNYEVGDPQVTTLLSEANVRFGYTIEPVLKKDSLAMTDEDRQKVRDTVINAPERMIVVTHGTDTMAITGRALLGIPEKTIVLTGAIQPARFRTSDALFNLGTAIAAVQLAAPGVYIAMNGIVIPAQFAKKNRELGCFEVAPEEFSKS